MISFSCLLIVPHSLHGLHELYVRIHYPCEWAHCSSISTHLATYLPKFQLMNIISFPYLLDSNSVFTENNLQRRFKIFILSPLLIIPGLVSIFLRHYCHSFVLARQINAMPMFRVWSVLVIAETFQSFWFWTFILLLSLLKFWWLLTDYLFNSILLFLALFVGGVRIILLSFLRFAFSILWT